MNDINTSSLWAILGVLVGILVISVNFWLLNGALPGYKIFAGPGILTAGLFSEEIATWPKIGIMLTGQYLSCFVLILAIKKIIKLKS